jgi:hypothetical protein
MPIPQQQLEPLMPTVIEWAIKEEADALKNGEPLNRAESEYAKAIGIRHPEKVRLLKVYAIPFPTDPMIRLAANEKGFVLSEMRGLTLGYAIFIREDCWRQLSLVVHELAHVHQYESHGGLSLLRQFVLEYFIDGYSNSSLEREAVSIEQRFLSAQ